MTRKSRGRRLFDNIVWLLKRHEANRYYNSYGLDVKGFRDPNDFVPYRRFAGEMEKDGRREMIFPLQ